MRRLLAVATVLLFAASPARSDAPPACAGTDLLARLESENAAGYERVVATASAAPNHEALLWRIEVPGADPSFLFGTAHVTDPRIVTLPPQAAEALAGASTVALELKEVRSAREMAAAALRQAHFMVLPPGQSLWDLIPDDQEYLVRDNANLMPGANKTIFGLQPWVVAMSLSVPLCELKRREAGVTSLDESLARQAEAQGAELVGLETMEEQFRAMSALPLDKQVDYLLAAAELSPKAADYLETLIVLYQRRLVTALEPLTAELETVDANLKSVMAGMEQSLLTARNQVMAERAAPLLDRGDAFIAVGALHLPGEAGLVALLREAGYKVTPVN